MQKRIELNLARNCLKYIIRLYGIKQIFIPYFTCPVVWNAIREENCRVKFYHIGEDFLPMTRFDKNDYILYANYFGINSKNCKQLSSIYPNLIIDNSQAFYGENYGKISFNSLRKFFNVQNGAYLYIDSVSDENFEMDYLNLEPIFMQKNYEKFLKNELILNEEKEIKTISPKIQKEMSKIDFENDKKTRLELYQKYSQKFDKYNRIKLKFEKSDIPYCYPFSTDDDGIKNSIIFNKLILLQMWQNFPQNFVESKFLNDTIAFPLNDEKYAQKILEVIDC